MQERLKYITCSHNGNDRGDAMEGALFYWLSWLGWVWSTFFMSKQNNYRLKIAMGLLILIITSPYKIEILGIEVYLSAIVLMMYLLMETAKLKTRRFINVFVTTFIIMIGYVSFLLFELFDPVWVIFNRNWMIALGGILMSSVLQTERHLQVLALGYGLLQGEVLFSFIMKKLSFPYEVASPAFLDIISLSAMLLSVWVSFHYIAELTSNYMNQGRGKQKSS